jgi:RNA polymerase sigma-70 factor (ECF subfamily)
MPDRTDAELAAAVAAGDQAALASVYARHGATVFGFARRVLRSTPLAEEVTQEVFVRLWRDPGRYDPQRAPLRAFLLRDAHGRAVDLLRAETARRAREEREQTLASEEAPGPEHEVWEAVRSAKVRHALESLPGPEKQAIVLAFYAGLSYHEVARRLGEPEGTIKSRIRRGLDRLRAPLLQEGVQ